MNYRQQIVLLEECIGRLESENRTKSRENEILLGELDRLAKENDAVLAEVSQLRNKVSAASEDGARQELYQQKLHLMATVAQVDSLRAENTRLKQEWNETVHRERILAKQLQEGYSECQQLHHQCQLFESYLKLLKEELHKSRIEASSELSKNQTDWTVFSEELQKAKTQIPKLNAELNEALELNNSLQQQIVGLTEQLRQTKIKDSEAYAVDLRRQLNSSTENEYLLNYITYLKEQLLTLTIEQEVNQYRIAQELAEKYTELNETKLWCQSVYDERNELEKEAASLRKMVQDKGYTSSQRVGNTTDIDSIRTNLMEIIEQKSGELAKAEEGKQQAIEELTQLRYDIARIGNNNDSLNRQYGKLKKRHDYLEEYYGSATHQLTEIRSKNEILRKQLEGHNSHSNTEEMDRLKRELDTLRTEVSSLISINLVMSSEMNELRQERNKLYEINLSQKGDRSEYYLRLNSSDITIYPRMAVDREAPVLEATPKRLLHYVSVLKSQKERLAERVFELNEVNQYLLRCNAQAESTIRQSRHHHGEFDSNSKSVDLGPYPYDGEDEEIQLPYRTADCRNFFEMMAQGNSKERPVANGRSKWSSLQNRINSLKRENEELKQSLGVRS